MDFLHAQVVDFILAYRRKRNTVSKPGLLIIVQISVPLDHRNQSFNAPFNSFPTHACVGFFIFNARVR